jgi:CP family cyanate transporter-like MFS transporter
MFSRMLCLPPIAGIVKDTLALSHSRMGLIFPIPVALLAATAIPSGILGDRIGPRKAAGIGAIVMAVGSFATGTATGFWSLFGYYCVFGLGFSMAFTSLPKLMGLWFPPDKVSMVTGIYGTGFAIGAAVALGITVSYVFPLTGSFRGTFYIWSLPVTFAAVLWWVVVKEHPSSRATPRSGEEEIERAPSYGVWKNRNLWFLAFVMFFQNMHFYTWTGWTPQLMMLKGASPHSAALMISLMTWVSIPFIFLIPWASHKLGLVKPFICISALGLAFASWVAIYIPVPWGWPLMVFIGILLPIFPLLLSLPVALVPKEWVGTASGMTLSIGYLGALVGPWLAGYLLDVAGNLNPALFVLIIAGFAFAGFGLLLPETGSRRGKTPFAV